jgi:glutamate-5-semialdehyde dehydrogenase
MPEVPVKLYLDKLLKQSRECAKPVSLLPGPVKAHALHLMAERVEQDQEKLLAANEEDVEAVGKSLAGETSRERVREAVARVRMSADDVKIIADRLGLIADLPDPLGEVMDRRDEANGLQVNVVRMPLGVLGVISEMNPLITAESIALCLKAGNVCVFRGAPEWNKTQQVLAAGLYESGERAGVPRGAFTILDRPEKEAALELIRSGKALDGIIPRGGPGLRRAVLDQAKMPVLCHDTGITHIYIDEDADIPMAQNLVINSKAQQPGAANAVDSILVQQAIARPLLSALILRLLDEFKVEVVGCPKTVALMGQMSMSGHKSVRPATDEDWSKQFQAATLTVKMVADMDEALAHIAKHGPSHTCAIVTKSYESARRFTKEVDAGAVLVNASTRLNAGDALGFGADLGLSTSRVHARGPIGPQHLTCEKYVVFGTGQLRQPHPVPLTYEDAIMLKRY